MDNPEFVDATDLDTWASRRDAQELLPRLIRSLLSATPGVTGLSARAGDGINVPGWDARADGGAGTAYVPLGISQWEFGTSNDPRHQAQINYRKRTEDPHGVTPGSAAFVFVTMRRWGAKHQKDDKDSWVRERQAEGVWREVVALDADDLEGWLDATSPVHVWLSERMGRQPFEVQTLDRWWETWSAQTRPVLPPELLLAGRRQASRELRQALQNTATAIGLYAGSRDEAIAFLAASLVAPDEQEAYSPADDPLAAMLLVSSQRAWTRVAMSPSRAILVVSDVDEVDVARAIGGGHHVVVPMGSGDDERRANIVLPRLARDEARDALQAVGWSFERADRHAVQARKSLRSLRRELALDPRVTRPGWARRPAADPFASLVLVGGWSPDSAADCDIVAAIAAREYVRLDRDLAEWAASDDPPFRRSGTSWRIVAPLDAWSLLRSILTRDDLARWHDAALRVLGELDPALGLPPAERPLAAIRGARRTWSNNLRMGLAQGTALLGAAGDGTLADDRSRPDHAAVLVRELLTRANGDVSGRVWQSLADVLPLLAEAAPEAFLDGVDTGLAGDPPLLQLMFTDPKDTAPWNVSSPHTGLLWALETLCWSSDYLSRAVHALARLAEVDPGGGLGNRPSVSLREILLPWIPRTAAPLARRLAVIDGVMSRRPSVGWPLLLGLLPDGHDLSTTTYIPMFRDWKPDDEGVPLTEYVEAVHQLVDRALRAAEQQPGRWLQLIHRLPDLPVDELNRSLDALEGVAPDDLDPGDRLALWTAVTDLAARHRRFSTVKWALADEHLTRFETIAARIEPVNTVERHARLFDWHPDVPVTDPSDHPSYERALDELRRAGVRDALEHGGVDALIHVAAQSKLPRLVGMSAADVGGDDLAMQLLPGLEADDGPRRDVATGWVFRMSQIHGWDWVRSTLPRLAELPERATSAFYLSLPAEPRTWALVAADTDAVQSAYYQAVNIAVAPADATALAERLLDRGRVWSAIDLLAFACHGNDDVGKAPAEVIERALRAALDPGVSETPRSASLGYDLGILLDNLEAAGAPADTSFELEWRYFPQLQHSRTPRVMHARLAAEPQLFVEAVCIATGKQAAGNDTGIPIASQRRGSALLDSWRRPPGTGDDGTIDASVLRAWVEEVRRLLAEQECADTGDRFLGELLSGTSPGADGVWPAEAIRDLAEDLGPNEDLEHGLVNGKFFSRGVTSRGVYDGGKQESALAHQFSSWAEQVEDQWPRTGSVLRRLAAIYATDARGEDATAEERADGGWA